MDHNKMATNIFNLIRGRRGSAIALDTFGTPLTHRKNARNSHNAQASRASSAGSSQASSSASSSASASASTTTIAETHALAGDAHHQLSFDSEDDAFVPLTRADTYKAHNALLHSSDEIGELLAEPGLYGKFERVSVIQQKKDALTKMNIYQLKSYIKNRQKNNDTSPVWIDMQGMDLHAIETVADALSLHPLTIEDCTVEDTREKIETRNNYKYIVINDYSKHPDATSPSPSVNLNILVYPDMVVTIHSKPVHSIYAIIPKLEYFEGARIPSVEFLFYFILTRVLDYYEAYITKLDDEAENLDTLVLSLMRVNYKLSSELITRINSATKQTSSLLHGLSVKREIFTQLLRSDIFSTAGLRYLKNSYDHLLKMHLKLNLTRDMLSDINTLYMSKLSVELSLLSNEVGVHMRRFGVIGTIFLPLNLIAGIFGMNVLVPGQARDDNKGFDPPFTTIMVIMVAITVAQIAIFYYLRWL